MVHIFFLFFYCLYGDGEFTAVEAAMSTMQLSMPTLVHWERSAFINCICVRMRSGNSVRRPSIDALCLCNYKASNAPKAILLLAPRSPCGHLHYTDTQERR